MIGAIVTIVAVLAALIWGDRRGYRRGRGAAEERARRQAKKLKEIRDAVEESTGAAGADAARKRVRDDWSR